MAGACRAYAARGTQDLTREVSILGNTLPRVYAPGYLPTKTEGGMKFAGATTYTRKHDTRQANMQKVLSSIILENSAILGPIAELG